MIVKASQVQNGDQLMHGPNRGAVVTDTILEPAGRVVLKLDGSSTVQVHKPSDLLRVAR